MYPNTGIYSAIVQTPFDFDSFSSMTIVQARAELHKMECPVVRWTQYQDLGHGEFKFTSDQLQRVLRPLNNKYDYLAMWQFGQEAYLHVRPLRQFIRSCKPMTEMRGRFCMSDGRFALVVDELHGDQARHFYPCRTDNIRLYVFPYNVVKLEMFIPTEGQPSIMIAGHE